MPNVKKRCLIGKRREGMEVYQGHCHNGLGAWESLSTTVWLVLCFGWNSAPGIVKPNV